jgi:hypothetical protein
MRRWGLLALLACLPVIAVAQPSADLERAKESFKAGATAYGAGEYLAAIQAFEAAYALTPLPPIAFSLAQAERRQYFAGHERAHLDRAIALFRRYVEQVPSGGRRADALDALSQLEPLGAARTGESSAVSESAARPTRLMITSDAPGALLALDQDPPAPSPLIREVEPGAHRVTASAPGFFPADRALTAVAGELVPMAVALRERPSLLTVSAPPDAELYLDGAFAGRGGDGLHLQLASGPHRLVVARKGHRVHSQALTLERGETQSLRVDLQPTTQRRAARRLLIASGVALGAGAVLGGLALHAESNAKDFLARRERGNVSAGDLHQYDEDVTARGRYRTAAAVAGGLAVALATTGLFLHELDNPEAQELYRAARPSPDERPPAPESAARLRLQFAPLVYAGVLGGVLEGRFR